MSDNQIPAELEKQLMTIGLTNYQARVYRALYILNECSISQIAVYSKVPTAKIYSVIKELKEMGLISEILKTRPAMFKAHLPDQFIEQEKNKIIELGKNIKQSLKQLEKFRKKDTPIEAYETTSIGNEALMKSLLMDLLSPPPQDVVIIMQEDLDFYKTFFSRLEREVKAHGTSHISVTLIDPYGRDLEAFTHYPSLNIRMIPSHLIPPSIIDSLKNLYFLVVMDDNCFTNIIKTAQSEDYLHIKSSSFAEFLRSILKTTHI
ncbi:MAG TPA: helix-turn-helix domain-containing protein [Candidatus Deferrimicrobium sp.]|nr:helix-turn-helix domain-containing protein [Candidatus Deferrimicrobium sp.]